MAVVGAILWISMTVIYIKVYKRGKKARKWYGAAAYAGLALFAGGMMELYKAYLQNVSSFWIIGGIVVFLYLTGQFYIMENIEW
jgi:hypothetical protein